MKHGSISASSTCDIAVADFQTRRVSTLTVTIDRTLCVGFGDCVEAAPDAFLLDDEGVAEFHHPDVVPSEVLIDACRVCPVDALIVVDESGLQIVP